MGVLPASILIVLVGVGMLFAARFLASGAGSRNLLVGLRIPATLASDRAWTAGNSASAAGMVAAGVINIVAGLASATLALTSDGPLPAAIALLLSLPLMLAAIGWAIYRGQRAAREAMREPPPRP